jgi:apolipoprotein N-acyltransferase
MEAVSRRTLFGLSWALLGLPLADYPVLAQAASLAGPEIMSFLVIALNVSIVLAIRERTGKPLRLALAQGPGLLILAVIFGLLRLAGGSAAPPQRVAVVQPMLSQQIRWDNPENRLPSLARLNSLIDRATTPRPDLIVLPEGILPALLRYEPDLAGFATEAVRRSGIPMLLGSIDRDYLSKVYNVAFRIGIDGEVDQYRKRRLVPFVEETPWPFRYRPADGWVQFSPGNGSALMPLGEGKQFAVLMCLEDTYPDLASEYAREGADLLVSMLNTENFRGTNQSLAHLRRARLTAVSAGLPMLRAGNSGISCSLDARGRMVAEVQPNLESAAQLPVSTARAATVYGSIGDAGVLSGLLAMVALEWLWIVERRRPVSFVPALRRRQDRVQQVS